MGEWRALFILVEFYFLSPLTLSLFLFPPLDPANWKERGGGGEDDITFSFSHFPFLTHLHSFFPLLPPSPAILERDSPRIFEALSEKNSCFLRRLAIQTPLGE